MNKYKIIMNPQSDENIRVLINRRISYATNIGIPIIGFAVINTCQDGNESPIPINQYQQEIIYMGAVTQSFNPVKNEPHRDNISIAYLDAVL